MVALKAQHGEESAGDFVSMHRAGLCAGPGAGGWVQTVSAAWSQQCLGGSHPGRQDPASLRVGTSCPLGCSVLADLCLQSALQLLAQWRAAVGSSLVSSREPSAGPGCSGRGTSPYLRFQNSPLVQCSNLIEGHKPWPHLTQGSL